MSNSPEHPPRDTDGPAARPALPTQYKPTDHEARIRERWENSGSFHPDPSRVLSGQAKPYAIVIPPPNVTDRLHLGHALNNTLQDVLVRAHRMMGFETLWMPGTDHAGIATQTVVEKRVLKETGKKRMEFSREEFVAKIKAFKDEYEATITGQLKAMGCSCDWARQRFTMDEQCARAVNEAFFRLFRDGLIYRGKRLVNWDPVTQTALADDEVEMEEVDGHFYYLRYPLVGGPTLRGGSSPRPVTWSELRQRGYPVPEGPDYADDAQAFVTVATTRPETYLGDTAVGINPRDPRAVALRGLSVELPLVGRVISIIEDDYVVLPKSMAEALNDPEAAADAKADFATGFLKVTPAHDPNDYELGQRHNLAIINVMAPDASISDKHGWTDIGDAHIFVGKGREEARKLVIKEFQARGLVESIKPYRHSVGHSYRSHAAIEPYLSDQWYVKVTDESLAGAALRAMSPDQTSAERQRPVATTPRPATDKHGHPHSAADGALHFHPDRYAKMYESWNENIRDWCISRQLWWGHQIPVWTAAIRIGEGSRRNRGHAGDTVVSPPDPNNPEGFPYSECAIQESWDDTTGEWRWYVCPPPDRPDVIAALNAQDQRDPDVLDTWFSSALWPISTMGWPQETDLLKAFNPTDTLCTAREIITLWVSRMVMFNRYFRGQDLEGQQGAGRGPLPFRDVFIHCVVQDGEGRKMSKSLGNGVDPLDIIASHGTDAMRFTIAQMATHTQDVRLPVVRDPASGKNTSPKFDAGRNFCNKLWNAARFAITILESSPSTTPSGTGVPPVSTASTSSTSLSLPDRWMLSRLRSALESIEQSLTSFSFAEYAQTTYDLLWRDFCDWYLEAIKPTVATNPSQRAVLAHALESIVRLLHPIAPFITEAIWERLREIETASIPGITLAPARKAGLLATAGWPQIYPSLRDEAAERDFENLRGLITAIREVRAQHNVLPRRRITLHAAKPFPPEHEALIKTLAGVEAISTDRTTAPSAPFTFNAWEYRLSNLTEAVDAEAESARLEKAIADRRKTIATLEGRLNNPGYADKAPPAMVQQTRDQLAKAQSELAAAEAALKSLKGNA